MFRILLILSLAFSVSFTAIAAPPSTEFPTLRTAQDPRLQARLESRIKHLKLDGPVRRGQLAVSRWM